MGRRGSVDVTIPGATFISVSHSTGSRLLNLCLHVTCFFSQDVLLVCPAEV